MTWRLLMYHLKIGMLSQWIGKNGISCILEDVQKLWIPSTQVHNIPLEFSIVDMAIPFNIWLIIYTIIMDNPKLLENILNVPVDELSINITTSHDIQGTAYSTFHPEISQRQAIILGWARQVKNVCVFVCVCMCVCTCVQGWIYGFWSIKIKGLEHIWWTF